MYHSNLDGRDFRYNLHFIARDFPQLTHLELSYCDVDILPSSGFTSLRTFDLAGCVLHGNLAMLFSACPMLENLTLNYVDLDGEKCLDLVAPNLRNLKLVRVEELKDFSITTAPVLEMVALDLLLHSTDDDDGYNNLIKILGNMPLVNELQLHHEILMVCRRFHYY